MPYKLTEVPAGLFMEHAGVRVYCTYKNDEIDEIFINSVIWSESPLQC